MDKELKKIGKKYELLVFDNYKRFVIRDYQTKVDIVEWCYNISSKYVFDQINSVSIVKCFICCYKDKKEV